MKTTTMLIACGLLCAAPAVADLPEVFGVTAPDAPLVAKAETPRLFSSGLDTSLLGVPIAVALPALDVAALEAEDESSSSERSGVSRDVRVGEADGVWTRVDGQGWLWTVDIVSSGAASLRLHFSKLDLSRGAQLVVYAPSRPEDSAGPFEEKDLQQGGEFWTSPVSGSQVRLELLVPVQSAESPSLGALALDLVLHGYRDPSQPSKSDASVAATCGEDIVCQPAWASVARGVGVYEFLAKTGKPWPYPTYETYWCSGMLLNTLAGDLTPYFLTDNACYDDTQNGDTDVVYWDFKSPTCGGSPPSPASVPRSTGVFSVKRTNYANLLMIEGSLPANRQWLGWNPNPLADGTPVTGVGHDLGLGAMIVYSGTKTVGDGIPFFCGVPADPIEIVSATGGARNGSGLFRNDTQQLIGDEWCRSKFSCIDAIYAGFATTYADMASFLAGGSDDDLEDNDTCTVPYFVSSSLQFNDLIVKSGDPDWYRIRLLSGQSVTVSLSFTHSYGDIDMRLYDACGGSIVASSTGTTDTENITYSYGGAGQHDFLLTVYLFNDTRNGYVMSVTYGLPANLNAGAIPPGFASPAVPRVSGDATTSSATLPAELIGDTYSTWVNWGVQQTGSGALMDWEGQLWLDDESVPGYWTFFAPNPSMAGWHYGLNIGPNTIRGGRHSLVSVADGLDLVPETNESDNVWRGQWVWRPPQTTANTPLERDVPPAVGFFTQPNSDGFRFDRPASYAWVTGLAPTTPGDDYDLIVYDDYVGSTSGFSHQVGGSAGGGVSTDFVVGHYTDVQTTLYPAAVRWNAPHRGPCLVDQSDASPRNTGVPGSFLSQVLAANRLVDVYEVFLDPGQTTYIRLSRRSGAADVAFQVFPTTSGGIWSRDDPNAAPSVAVDADLDTLAFTGDGWHPVVVYRLWGNEASGPVSYDLFFNAQPIVDVAGEHREFELGFSGARPNPVEQATTFSFTLPRSGRARLTIFDVNGRAVERVMDDFLDAGPHAVPWTARRGANRLGPGLYWSRLEWEGRSLVKSIAVLR